METVQELISLAKELMAWRPSRKLVKLYVLGGVLAFFGVVIGLVETVCSPFTVAGRLRDEEAAVAELLVARKRKVLATQTLREKSKQQEAVLCSRALSNRQHAS
ncbi:G0/G1 switch protein 2 [Neomonachus schauinslandi]|uniref:G0/G1 switch protein 2 n=1 Tax=Neomonachus schauinslandi TaxID=29088 RepID=A0A2Y9GGE0_NEOSC|nr:G0/G1 switch protein 2 [Neomonachus schauinslandi]